MKTFVINLKRSTDRKKYMIKLLSDYDNLDVNFVEGIDGTMLSDQEVNLQFDQLGAFSLYGRKLINNEVGCTLSHCLCAELLLKSGDNCALILEDDLVISVSHDDFYSIINELETYVSSTNPTIILLSGDYWWTSKKRTKSEEYQLAKVREAVCAQAYVLNRSAATILVNKPKIHLADDWYSISQYGIKLEAVYPHIADQNRAEFKTVISEAYDGVHRKLMPFNQMIKSYYRAVIKKILLYMGHFEAKKFKTLDNNNRSNLLF